MTPKKPRGSTPELSVDTLLFARPHIKELLGTIDFIVSKDYSARGEA